MGFLQSILRAILPVDPEPGCGYGPFKLPADHPFTPACNIHDWEFDQAHAGTPDETLIEADADLFWRWAFIARQEKDPVKQMALIEDIIEYWPLARRYGKYLWDGKEKPETKE